jgi:hypothetical protein
MLHASKAKHVRKLFFILTPIIAIPFFIAIALIKPLDKRDRADQNTQTAALSLGGAVTPTVELVEVPTRYQFSVKTNILPKLLPHEHEIRHDSVTDEGHGVTISSPTVLVPEDMWVVGYHTVINHAPYTTLHHNGLWRLDEAHPICPAIAPARHIYVAANDVAQASIEFPESYGMFLPKGTPLVFQAMLHNPLPPLGPGEPYENVSVEVVIEFEKPGATNRVKPLEFFQLALEDAPCDPKDSVFSVPAGAGVYTKQSKRDDNARYTFQDVGVVIALGNHLHAWEGGKSVDVFLNDRAIATLSTQRSSPEPWSWFSPRLFPFLWINKGDTISISATYENPNDTPIRGAMGMIGFYFSPKDSGLILAKPYE